MRGNKVIWTVTGSKEETEARVSVKKFRKQEHNQQFGQTKQQALKLLLVRGQQ